MGYFRGLINVNLDSPDFGACDSLPGLSSLAAAGRKMEM
jgi:hypothetical protein